MKPMIEHFAEINAQLEKEESSIMDELEGVLNQIALLKRDNADSYQHIENLELQQYAIEEYYQDQVRMLEFKIELLSMALKDLHPDIYDACIKSFERVHPQRKES